MGCNIARLGHMGIHVSDVERSIKFYRDVLGLKLTGKWGPPDFSGRFVLCVARRSITLWFFSSWPKTP